MPIMPLVTLDAVVPAYNCQHDIVNTLRSLLGQQLVEGVSLAVYVVDDGSTDETRQVVEAYPDDRVHLLSFEENVGRGGAINRGVAAGSGDIVIILDADCRLVSPVVLKAVVAQMNTGLDVCFGQTVMHDQDFWGRYHQRVNRSRDRCRESFEGLTTAVMAIRRNIFTGVGGFYEGYRYYGFEDRDFIVRLQGRANKKRLSFFDELQAWHEDEFDLGSMLDKFYVSGRYSARVFRERFPCEYANMLYGRVERLASTALGKMLIIASRRFILPSSPLVVRICMARVVPDVVKVMLVRVCLVASYCRGIVER